jgi:NitT/TauT family transport system permease protein
MFKKNVKNRIKDVCIPALFLLGGFFLWEGLAAVLNVPEFFLPQPSKVILEVIAQFDLFLRHLYITMFEALSGYLVAILLSFTLATIFVHSKTMEKGLYPYAIAIKIAPTLAMAPFVILWFGIGLESKIVIVTLICFFPLLVNTVKGLKTVDEEALNLLKSLSASQWQIFLKLRLPSSLPFIFPALKISSTLAITGAFVGEFLAANQGIGYLILLHSRILNTTTALAALFVMILAGILLFSLISLIEKKVVFWQKSEEI